MDLNTLARRFHIAFFHFRVSNKNQDQVLWFAHPIGTETGAVFATKQALHDRLLGFANHQETRNPSDWVSYCGRLGDRIKTTMSKERFAEKQKKQEKISLAMKQLGKRKLTPEEQALLEEANESTTA